MSIPLENFPYLDFVAGFIVFISIIHLILDLRQLKAVKRPHPPPEIKHLYTDGEEYKRKQAYLVDKIKFGIVHSVFDTIVNISLLYYGFLPKSWAISGTIIESIRHFFHPRAAFLRGEIVQSIGWLLITVLWATVESLPWSYYKTFILEQKHGFNKTTMRTFVMDKVKSLALTTIILPPIVAAVVYILNTAGPRMPLYLWLFMFVLSIVMMTVYPTLIAPLFNKYDPLPEGSLKSGIEDLASQLNFPLKKLFVVDGSTRSAHSNAYMYGFFNNKRIVLYDTLISQCTESQVLAVLLHECGHWKLGHTPVLFVASQVLVAAQLSLFAFSRGVPGLYTSFKFPSAAETPALAALMIFQLMIGPVDEILGLLQNLVSRTFEYQADAFAVKHGKGEELKKALLTLDKENKGDGGNCDTWYSTYHHSHPPLPQRLQAIDAELKKIK